MALTRKMLKAMGIEEEKIEQIIEAHSETVDALKDERDGYRDDADKYADTKKKLDDANNKISQYENGEEKVAKSDYDKIDKELKELKESIATEKTKNAKDHALRELYKGIGISEKRIDSVMKVTAMDTIELDEQGNIKDVDTFKANATKEWADFIETDGQKGANTGKSGSGEGGDKDLDKMSMSEYIAYMEGK